MKTDSTPDRFRISPDREVTLADHDPTETDGLDKGTAKTRLDAGIAALGDLQERLYARGRWALLVILQGMDASGKDGLVKHVMAGVNPQGCRVTSFKAPNETELKHDFLWRTTCALPERGWIGLFNRSYYEEVLVVRVHPDYLDAESLPKACLTDTLWQHRFESIRAFERHLARNGTAVVKVFLNISRDEQKKRLMARIDDPEKHWKFDAGDIAERQRWGDYASAYEQAIAQTSTDDAPWYVVPADHKWFARLTVAEIIVERLKRMDPKFPVSTADKDAALARARAQLLAE